MVMWPMRTGPKLVSRLSPSRVRADCSDAFIRHGKKCPPCVVDEDCDLSAVEEGDCASTWGCRRERNVCRLEVDGANRFFVKQARPCPTSANIIPQP